ncbi:MAG: M28 family peptidase, partial [Methylophilaceae bacterium]
MKKFITTSIVMVLLVFPISLLAWVKQVGMNDIDDIKLTGLSAADSARMKLDVEKFSIDYAKRNVENVPTLNLAEQYVESELKKVTNRVEIQSYQVDNEKFNNVIAHFGPTAGKPIIIGAHYDAHENTMGADDNASGVAGLLELARIFSKQPPNVPVQIVAYTLEEPPNFRTDNMGSRHHALSLVQADIKPKLVLVLEMIGFYNDAENSQAYPVG